MKKVYFSAFASLISLSLLAIPVMADNNKGFYVGAGISGVKDLQDGVDNLTRIRAKEFFGGYKYNDALGAEIRFGNGYTLGTSSFYFDNENKVKRGKLEREIGNYTSIYYRPELVNDEAKLYALLGYTSIKSSATIYDASGKLLIQRINSASGYSYGIGIGFVVSDHFNFNVEYKNICDEISGKPNTATVNMDYRF